MGQAIQLKRGNNANLASLTLAGGEPAFVLDTGKLYVGNGTDKVLINPDYLSPVTSVAGKTGAVTLTQSDVGLGNVTNESKSTMFTNPAFTGIPSVPTAAAGTNTTQSANTIFVMTAIANLVNSSPTTLDTLKELATALGNDPNFATTITNALGLKAPLASPIFTGTVTAPTFVGAVTGNASTANKLATARTINGVAFDGSTNITIAADMSTIDGGTF